MEASFYMEGKLGIYVIAVTNFFGMFYGFWSLVICFISDSNSSGCFIEYYYEKAAFVYRFDSMIESELERQQRIYRLYIVCGCANGA